ncbi:hypothetical protein MVES1_000408 [Malassezia vespertilionis]|uniref:uncharacterized protein n=1 Tax=Malassezia vespertilionis TaxID=2020962 RepID=UPI0024B069C0|nr:uncharacterized protein MVES1_000408 [Malassezia vespertilionis]WFD05082.1 hypothetical protein MVES1_000408 [Malassezia vespertilionis]
MDAYGGENEISDMASTSQMTLQKCASFDAASIRNYACDSSPYLSVPSRRDLRRSWTGISLPTDKSTTRHSSSDAHFLLAKRPSRPSQDLAALAKRLKARVSVAELSAYAPSAQFYPSLQDEKDAVPLPVECPPASDVMTPHSLLFYRPAGTDSTDVTPSSSWSSCTKYSSDADDSAGTVSTSIESEDTDGSGSKTALASSLSDTSTIGMPDVSALRLYTSFSSSEKLGKPGPMRPRSKSDVMPRPESLADMFGKCLQCAHRNEQHDELTPFHTSPVAETENKSAAASAPTSPLTLPNTQVGYNPWMDTDDSDKDFSAYISGIGNPIDPDIEFSSVMQLQTFRIHSRSRSVTRGDCREERRQKQPSCLPSCKVLPFAALRHSCASPRPPLLNVRDTDMIPPLAALGSAICNPGYNLRSSRCASPSRCEDYAALLDAPPAVTPPPDASLAADPALGAKELHGLGQRDENGFRTVYSRQQLNQARRKQQPLANASRLRVDEPEPLALEAFEDDLAKEEEHHDEDARGRSPRRGRGRSVARVTPYKEPASQASFAKKGSSVIGLAGEHRSSLPTRKGVRSDRGRRRENVLYSDAVLGSRTTHSADARESRRGRRGAVKAVTSLESPGASSDVAPESAAMVRSSSLCDERASLTRPRLLSNGGHLLMLSLEIAMIKNNKIHAPLKQRWGKRRDDDFRPIPDHLAQTKMLLSRAHRRELAAEDELMCGVGSSLKNIWIP